MSEPLRLRGMRRASAWIESLPRPTIWLAALGMGAVISAMDYLSGNEVGFSIFYLAPVACLAWFAGRPDGLAAALLSALNWGIVDVASGARYSSPAITVWNTAVRFGFFVIVALLLASLREAHEMESEMARTDSLTGIANGRVFYERLASEIARSARTGRPFAVSYIDLDRFKAVNDSLGHGGGDDLLRGLAGTVKGSLRGVDTVARLGGDEFGILLPETAEEDASTVITRVHERVCAAIRSIEGMPEGVSATIGCVMFDSAPEDADSAVGQADALMYEGKEAGRGRVFMRGSAGGPIKVLAMDCPEADSSEV